MRIMNAMPANVVVAASIDPNDDQSALPLMSEATTSTCTKPKIAVATNERLNTRRSIAFVPAPGHTKALVNRIPTAAMIARYDP